MAFYYPGHLWSDSDWVKNLLLFFDGIALLVPEYKLQEPELRSPELAAPLKAEGLLECLPADQVVDRVATEHLAQAMARVIDSGHLDSLDRDTAFHSLSMSRLGWDGAPELYNGIYAALEKRQLVRGTQDGVSIRIHPMVRVLVLALLSQILRSSGSAKGIRLSPATDRRRLVEALTDLLSVAHAQEPSAGDVVAFDLETVGVDLTLVPLNEILDFRRQHLDKHKAYAAAVRQFVREISLLPAPERRTLFEDRQQQLRDMASDLKTLSRTAWRKPAAFALSAAGAAWTVASGDLTGGILAVLAAIVGLESDKTPSSAYSYLFAAARDIY